MDVTSGSKEKSIKFIWSKGILKKMSNEHNTDFFRGRGRVILPEDRCYLHIYTQFMELLNSLVKD